MEKTPSKRGILQEGNNVEGTIAGAIQIHGKNYPSII